MKYEKVPFIITNKDMDYLSDSFNWEYGAYKNAVEAQAMLEDENLAKHMNNASEMFDNHMNTILEIIKEAADEN